MCFLRFFKSEIKFCAPIGSSRLLSRQNSSLWNTQLKTGIVFWRKLGYLGRYVSICLFRSELKGVENKIETKLYPLRHLFCYLFRFLYLVELHASLLASHQTRTDCLNSCSVKCISVNCAWRLSFHVLTEPDCRCHLQWMFSWFEWVRNKHFVHLHACREFSVAPHLHRQYNLLYRSIYIMQLFILGKSPWDSKNKKMITMPKLPTSTIQDQIHLKNRIECRCNVLGRLSSPTGSTTNFGQS